MQTMQLQHRTAENMRRRSYRKSDATLPDNIGGVPVRYRRNDRWTWNNGFRLLWLALGKRESDAINAARRGDLHTVTQHYLGKGGVRSAHRLAQSAIRLAAKLGEDIPPYRIEHAVNGYRIVVVPRLTWRFHGRCQRAHVEWMPLWSSRNTL